jgi:hypothetical protein
MKTLAVTKDQADQLDQISFGRRDALGVTFDGELYRCADVRSDPAYSDYWPILGGPLTEQQQLAQVRAAAHDLRSAERVLRQTGGFPYDGHTYRSDREESIPLMVSAAIHAQVAIAMGAEAVSAYNAALGNGWRDETGVARLTTAQEILALHGAFVAWGAANDRASQQIAADIDAAETVETLEATIAAISTDVRWPE